MTNISNADLKAFYGMAKQKLEESYELLKRAQNGCQHFERRHQKPRLWMITLSELYRGVSFFQIGLEYIQFIYRVSEGKDSFTHSTDLFLWRDELQPSSLDLGDSQSSEAILTSGKIDQALLDINDTIKRLDTKIKDLNRADNEIQPL